MNSKLKDNILITLFLVFIFGTLLLNILIKDKEISEEERRKLKQFPKITLSNIFSGNLSNEMDKYVTDQMVFRNNYRNIKANFNFNVLRKKDNNGYFMVDNSIYKDTGKLNEKEVLKSTNKFNSIKNNYLKDNKIFFSIIPDKCYFLEDYDLKMDYAKLEKIMIENLEGMEYVDISPVLDKEDYYLTDTHWKQENLIKVADKIISEMDEKYNLKEYEKKLQGNFNGVYSGQIGLKIKQKDDLKYIVTDNILNSKTYNYENKEIANVYNEDKFKNSKDKYDFFVSGPTPLIEIENKKSNTNKELIIFRDSFGSSIAPLFLENYSKITLVDLRYMPERELGKYIDFEEKDVIFLYSTLVLNSGSSLK